MKKMLHVPTMSIQALKETSMADYKRSNLEARMAQISNYYKQNHRFIKVHKIFYN